jgi:hypothetical protein
MEVHEAIKIANKTVSIPFYYINVVGDIHIEEYQAAKEVAILLNGIVMALKFDVYNYIIIIPD